MRSFTLLLPTCSLLALFATSASGASIYTYAAAIVKVDSNSGFGEVNESFDGLPVSASVQSINDFEGQTTFGSAGASASATFGTIRAQASVNITNGFNAYGTTDPVTGDYPYGWDAGAEAITTETLQYGGQYTNYTSTFYYYLTGDTLNGFASVRFNHAGDPSEEILPSSAVFGRVLKSSSFVNNAPQASFRVELRVGAGLDVENIPEPNFNYNGFARLGATLQLIGVDVRDENVDGGQKV